jgi:hypothetical protein
LYNIEEIVARVEKKESPSQVQTMATPTRDMAHISQGSPGPQDGRPVGVHHIEEERPFVQGQNPSFTSNIYQNFTNPLSYLVKALPVVDGNDAHVFCEFLLKVINIRKVGQISEPTIYEHLYPCCRGDLLTCLNQAL